MTPRLRPRAASETHFGYANALGAFNSFAAGGRQEFQLLMGHGGESDLIFKGGEFYLAASCWMPEPALLEAAAFLGVDLGVANIATDSDGHQHSGSQVKNVRYRHRRLRRKLQRKGTKAARRRLKLLSGRESRFARHTNHVISKEIVARAEGTRRGIKLEDLGGIRDRITVRRGQRVVLHSWAFFQLRTFIAYKAILAGVPLILVDPRNTSRECSQCGHIAKENRPSQSKFRCVSCGHETHADFNAACVIAGRPASKPGEGRKARLGDLCGKHG